MTQNHMKDPSIIKACLFFGMNPFEARPPLALDVGGRVVLAGAWGLGH